MKTLLLATMLAVCCGSAGATELAKPSGPVVLTVKGHIAHANVDGTAQFDMQMLERLAGREAVMETPWTNGTTRFSGPFVRALLEEVGAEGNTIVLRALNDYASEMPLEDATGLDTILAIRMNGSYMSVRDKGPIFLIYPFDQDTGLYNEKYFSRSVWQISEIEIED